MSKRYVLSEYVELAMGQALYDKLHRLPVIGNIDLNKEPAREPVDSL